MTSGNRFACALALLSFALVGCRSSSSGVRGPGGERVGTRDYALVWYRSTAGSEAFPEDVTLDQLSAAATAQAELHARLVDDGSLLFWGPLDDGSKPGAVDWLLVLDEEDAEHAADVMAEDPMVQLGMVQLEVVPLRTLDLLQYVPAMDATAQEELGGSATEPVLRAYCIVTAEDGTRGARALGSPIVAQKVLLVGRLGGDRDGELFAILDVDRPSLARPYMIAAAGGHDLGLEFSPWMGTPALQTLAREGPPADGPEGDAAGQESPPRIDASK